MKTEASQQGNAIFIILVAVALLAALYFVMSRDSGGARSAMTQDQARLYASDMIQYGDGLRPIIDRMMLMGGVLDTDSPAGSGILFDPPGSMQAPNTRELFDPAGGNAPYMNPPADACLSTCSYTFTGQITLTGAGDDSNPELSMILVDVTEPVCQMADTVLGNGSIIPTGSPLTAVTPFTGTNYGGVAAVTLSIPGGGREFCYQESGGGRYIYVNVIRAR